MATKKSKNIISFKAFDLSRTNVGMYLAAVKPSEIFPYVKVSRVQEDPESGFQRALEAHRSKRISEYIRDGKVVPGAIILSAQNSAGIKFENDILSFNGEEGVFLVIDGQHRIYGSKKAEEDFEIDHKIPICILSDLNLSDEVQYFIDINGNQKGVTKTLRIELTKFLVEEQSVDGIRLKLFDDLNSDPKSPLMGRLSATRRGIGYISHVPFKNSLDRILDKDPLKKLEYEKKKKLIINYLSGIFDNLSEVGQEKRMYQSAFFQAVFRIFEKACDVALLYHRNYNKSAFLKIFEFLQDFNFDSHSGSNEESIVNLVKELSLMLDVAMTTKSFDDGLID